MILKILKGLFSFRGRLSLGKFLLCELILIPLGIIVVLPSCGEAIATQNFNPISFVFLVLYAWIFRALFVRRLHDLGRSGTLFKGPGREFGDFFAAHFKKGQSCKNQYDLDQ